MADLKEFIRGMPKAELHMHLEGAFEPALVERIARRNNLPVPAEVQKSLAQSQSGGSSGFAFDDLSSFLAVYYQSMSVLQTADDFHDLAWHYLSTAHAQNIVYAELFFDPQAHTSRGVKFETVITGYHSAVVAARSKLGISASLILCFLRDHSASSAEQTLTEALPHRDKFIGIGLDSDERDNPPSKFAGVFAQARAHGFKLTMHADVDQINSIEHIRQAIEEIGVDRLDHGTNIVESPALVEVVRARGIGLTSCPVSNSVINAKDFKGKEILTLLRDGVKVTVNSDDPAYFRAYLSENLEMLAERMDGVTKGDLIHLQKNAFEVAWLSDEERGKFIARLEEYGRG